jgi:signal transduction histidine kinase
MMPSDTTPKVLVIDDEFGPRESLRFLLKPDYRVFCAEGVDRGLELLREHEPDAVILDIRMPGRNGLEGLREIRRIDPDTAVIMLTGYAALGTAQEAVRNDANDYMEKPFDAGEMRRTVHWHVARTRLRRQRVQLAREMERMQERLTSELRQKDHLAELGQASAEFVHDLRNALAVAGGSAELLRLELGGEASRSAAAEPAATDAYLDMMERTIIQCRDMLDTWGRLIKQEPSQPCAFSLGAFVRGAVAACQPAAQAVEASLLCTCEADDAEALGDEVQLGRALTNVIHNAIQALPATGGCVRVSLKRQDQQVLISVTDNGCGIPAEHLEHLFKPHFTTKQARGGMGLGLFIAYKVVEAHHGTLSVESKAGQGTTMRLMLPVCSASDAAAALG